MSEEPANAGEGMPPETPAGLTECSRLFGHWLASENAVLAISSLDDRGLAFGGLDDKRQPTFGMFDYPGIGAIASAPDGSLWLSQKLGLWKLENGARTGGFTAQKKDVYLPRLQHITGDLGITDLAVDGNGALLICSGTYSMVGKACADASIEPVWKPPFITKFSSENRCGLSGLGLYDAPRHCVSLWSRSDQPHGWKKDYLESGLVMTIQDGSILCEGLTLPRAPRWGQGGLFLLNAGTAEFGRVDLDSKRFVPLCQCPAYPTGLALHGHWAVIAVTEESPDLPGLPAHDSFASRGIKPFCGLLLVDTRTGDIAHNARFENSMKQVTSVAVITRTHGAVALGAADEKHFPLVTLRRSAPRQ